MGIIRTQKGATTDLDYLLHFQEYAENVSTVEGVLKPYTTNIELYGGKVNSRSHITSQVKVSFEIIVFDTIEERNNYKKKEKQNG